MASTIGLTVPAMRLMDTGCGAVMLTHRFDRTQLNAPHGAMAR